MVLPRLTRLFCAVAMLASIAVFSSYVSLYIGRTYVLIDYGTPSSQPLQRSLHGYSTGDSSTSEEIFSTRNANFNFGGPKTIPRENGSVLIRPNQLESSTLSETQAQNSPSSQPLRRSPHGYSTGDSFTSEEVALTQNTNLSFEGTKTSSREVLIEPNQLQDSTPSKSQAHSSPVASVDASSLPASVGGSTHSPPSSSTDIAPSSSTHSPPSSSTDSPPSSSTHSPPSSSTDSPPSSSTDSPPSSSTHSPPSSSTDSPPVHVFVKTKPPLGSVDSEPTDSGHSQGIKQLSQHVVNVNVGSNLPSGGVDRLISKGDENQIQIRASQQQPAAKTTVHRTLPVSQIIPKDSGSHTSTGYVLAVNYYEQQSMGSRNLFQLQCWAQTLGLSVVKPVMKDSFLRTPLDARLQYTLVKFEDSFNLAEWNKYTEQQKYAPLVEWKSFLSRAPRSVIIVRFEYPSVTLLKSRHREGEPILHQPHSERYASGCTTKWPSGQELSFLKAKGFTVVRSVCFNFYFGDQLTLEEFNSHLLGEFAPESVTIIMEMWRGLGSAQRVLIKDTCNYIYPVQEHISLSERLLTDTGRYIDRYLSSSPYLAVMGRLEMSLLTVHKREPVVPFCLRQTVSELEAFRKDTQLETTFLSIDIGKYGSKKYRSRLDPNLALEFEKFFRGIFGSSMSVRDWEKTFELVSHWKDAGYIALLQKVIVSRARCVLFVGGGAFQRHALHLYQELHPNPADQCIRVVKQCTRASKFEIR